MSGFALADAEVGAELPELSGPRISRALLALYAGASGDHNPVHIDTDAARAAGLDDVITHGMYSMALLGRLITSWVPVGDLLSFRVRFAAVTPVHAQLRCTARVTAVEEVDPVTAVGPVDGGARRARLAVLARIDGGPIAVRGEAVVRLPAKGG